MKNLFFFFVAFSLLSFSATAQIVNIPDANFKNALLNSNCVDTDNNGLGDISVDTNNDNQVQISEAAAVMRLRISGEYINSLTGIENFTNLRTLDCSHNLLTTIDLQTSINLEELRCNNNRLSILNLHNLINLQKLYCYQNVNLTLNVQGCTSLQTLLCQNSQLTTLNIQGLTNLQRLECSNNQLTSLNVQGLTNLQILSCGFNPLMTLNVQGLVSLLELYCAAIALSTINLQNMTNLQKFSCYENQLTTLNLEDLINLQNLDCHHNQLTSLFIKNGTNESILAIYPNSYLRYICCDETQLAVLQDQITQHGYNCAVNSYCSFTPGGTFYTLQGNSKFDSNANGCDANDAAMPNMKFNITDGIVSGSTIANTSGNYSIPVGAGTHTITPILENPAYFTVSPPSVQVTFPAAASPFIQNFCIAPNGTHHDVEVTLVPTTPARPGFDAGYQIVYKNKGNQTENGVVSFGFNDAKMDIISTSIAPSTTATGSRTWNYTLLKPFETRTINVILNINSPTETPAVNVGDELTFTANITLAATDEMPSDNTANFVQTVVGSYDPNDKTCAEGRQILVAKVGDYLHYTVRFENTGTANAQNIVVKDVIDLAKYDIASLQIQKASHDCRVRILNGNEAEFIFENINLPFTAPNKYGFVAFKIKTKSSLVAGDIAANKAAIFFDYNFPIVTNTASTQVVNVLAVEPVLELAMTIQPNPTSDILSFQTAVTIEKCEIYDALGRIVQSSGVQNQQISVTHLPKGSYFIQVFGKDGAAVKRFVKL